ncbi:hypothetical protein [Autumnicola psychrophila]|uniref:Rad50/SbcC-type AAA domain-containing protein n=1 Tax=Autumnicola psychrophila TaxID=3075592 RepID=A0ABU3DWP8_9FLAO|nr:hypothetical protein [Zunongwangia sp. F225]MDT0688128.1 hypothetical protein [Zunongwangia sp. F225]
MGIGVQMSAVVLVLKWKEENGSFRKLRVVNGKSSKLLLISGPPDSQTCGREACGKTAVIDLIVLQWGCTTPTFSHPSLKGGELLFNARNDMQINTRV